MRMILPPGGETLDADAVAAAYPWPDGTWVRGNMVATADGAARSPEGRSGGISSTADRLVFHTLRGGADVVLVGAGTARQERYRPATVEDRWSEQRANRGQRAAPVIALATRALDLDPDLPVFSDPDRRPIILTVGSAPISARERLTPVADIIECGVDRLDVAAAVAALAERGLVRILTEGGPSFLAGVAAAGVLDELDLTISPALAGGNYADGKDPGRIMAGPTLPGAPRAMRLAHLLEDSGTLFLRYLLQ